MVLSHDDVMTASQGASPPTLYSRTEVTGPLCPLYSMVVLPVCRLAEYLFLHLTDRFNLRACHPDSAVQASWPSTMRSKTLLETLIGFPTFSAALIFRSLFSALLRSEEVWNR